MQSDTTQPCPLCVFLSYAREDKEILDVVKDAFAALNLGLHDRLNIEVDEKLELGSNWRDDIMQKLKKADYLIVIYTGTEKPSHSFTGFEVGYFQSLIDAEKEQNKESKRKIITLHVGKPPTTVDHIKNLDLTINNNQFQNGREVYLDACRIADPLVQFFNELTLEISNREKKRHLEFNPVDQLLPDVYRKIAENIVPNLREGLFDCLGNRVSSGSYKQRMIKFKIPKMEFGSTFQQIPGKTDLIPYRNALNIFINDQDDRTITWEDFQTRLKAEKPNDHRVDIIIHSIEKAFLKTVSQTHMHDNNFLVPSLDDSDRKIFRLIPTSQTNYFNGKREIRMCLVETMENILNTNIIISTTLNFLLIAAKYRCLCFENRSQFSLNNFKMMQDKLNDMQTAIKSFFHYLASLEYEIRLHRLHEHVTANFLKGMDVNKILELRESYQGNRKALTESADKVLGANTESTNLSRIIKDWLLRLEKFYQITKSMNNETAGCAIRNLLVTFGISLNSLQLNDDKNGNLDNAQSEIMMMGDSKDSFNKPKELHEDGVGPPHSEMSQRRPNVKNRVTPEVEAAVVDMAYEQPAWGQVRVAKELAKRGLSISPTCVRTVWMRHDLENMEKRNKALETRMAH